MFFKLTRLIALLVLASLLGACTQSPLHKTQSIKADIDIPVKDAELRKITEVTSYAELSASGQFEPGNYNIKGVPVHIPDHCSFHIELSVPVDDPNVISLKDATGTLTTSAAVSVDNIQAPKKIELRDGKAIGDVDLFRMVGAFFFNVLERQLSFNSSDDTRKMISHMQVEKASFDLRPDSVCKIGPKLLHIADGSYVELTKLSIDPNLDYHGKCEVSVKFLPGCKWIGEKVDCDFDGGEASLLLNADRTNGVIAFSLAKSKQTVDFKNCVFRFGKNKRSSTKSARCDLDLDKVLWKRQEYSEKPDFHLKSKMLLTDTHIDIKTAIEETIAHFPSSVPTILQFDSDKEGRLTQFNSLQTETASEARIEITKPPTKVAISLLNAKIGQIDLDKSGDLSFSLRRGSAKLKQLDWSSGARHFTLATDGSADLEVPSGMSLDKQDGQSHLDLPVEIHLGEAKLVGKTTDIRLGNLNGSLHINLDKDVRINSDMDFTIEKSDLLGDAPADVRARGFTLESKNGDATARMQECTIAVDDNTIEDAIRDQLPRDKVFTLNKVVEKKKWRYRNVIVKTVNVSNLTLEDSSQEAPNSLTFSVAGDVEAQGTIDKAGMFDFSKDPSTKTKPWTATAHVNGNGTIKYSLLPKSSLADSELQYKLAMDLPIPDDVKLDWSQVSKGLMQAAERGVIVSHLTKITIPISYSGHTKIFRGKKKQQLSAIKVSKLVVRPTNSGSELSFSAEADL